MKHINALAFNRTASSTGETEALNYIANELEQNNIKPEIEHFNWTGPLKILIRVSYILIIINFLVFRMILIVIAYFILKNMSAKLRNISFIKTEKSKNIFTLISAKEKAPNRPLVIITAHYDSVSANLPFNLQVIIFFIYRLIIFFYGIIFFVFIAIFILNIFALISFSQFIITAIAFTSSSAIFISIPILYLVFRDHPSSGSIDNASGVSILIELAKVFKKDPLESTDILILWPGAEEWGLKGTKKFCKTHFRSLNQIYDLDKSFNINIDMIGSYIGLLNRSGLFRKKINRNLNEIFGVIAKQLNIPLNIYNKTFKPNSDYKTFKKYARKVRSKFQVMCFHSSKDSKYIHSLRDTPDKCSLENLNGCLNICHHALRSIDLSIEDVKKSQIAYAV